jgi:two-component system LytT family sensor kinase
MASVGDDWKCNLWLDCIWIERARASFCCTDYVDSLYVICGAALCPNVDVHESAAKTARVALFAGLTTAELLGISAILLAGIWFRIPLADIIVKRVINLYIWAVGSALLWAAISELNTGVRGGIIQDAGFALISVTLAGATLVFTPLLLARIDSWIDAWVFQVPNFDAAIQAFWEKTLELENGEEVYRAGEDTIRYTLSLASTRIARLTDLCSCGIPLPVIGPNPRFLARHSPLRSIVSPPADVLLPLFQEGAPEHWLVLSNGVIRPPLTAKELSFVTRIAGAIQGRIGTLVGEQRRLERLRKEGAFREEIADAELRALRAQINPHFLFNSLNTIADLSVVAPQKAEDMTLRLAAVFRYVLANTDRQFTSVNEEIDFARSYLGIEEARFGDRLKVQFESSNPC